MFKQKSAVLALTQTLNLTQTVTLALTLTLFLFQTQNLNPNTMIIHQKTRVNEHPLLLSYSLISRAHCMLERNWAIPLKKLTSVYPNRLYFITLDKDTLGGGANETKFERGNW